MGFFQAPYSKREVPHNSPFIALFILVECYLIIDVSLKAGLADISKQPDWGEILLSLLLGQNYRCSETCELSGGLWVTCQLGFCWRPPAVCLWWDGRRLPLTGTVGWRNSSSPMFLGDFIWVLTLFQLFSWVWWLVWVQSKFALSASLAFFTEDANRYFFFFFLVW